MNTIPPGSLIWLLTLMMQNQLLLTILLVPLTLILIDIVTGIVSAVKRQEFQLAFIANFLVVDIAKYLAAFAIVTFTWITSGLPAAATASAFLGMGTLALSTGSSIVSNIKEIGGSSPLSLEAQKAVEDLTALANSQPQTSPPPTYTPALIESQPDYTHLDTAMMPSVKLQQQAMNNHTVKIHVPINALTFDYLNDLHTQKVTTFSFSSDPLRNEFA